MSESADKKKDRYDPFAVGFEGYLKTRKSATENKLVPKPLRPDTFAGFNVPLKREEITSHLDNLAEYARQLHTLNPSSTKDDKDKVRNQDEPWEGNEPLNYVVELIHNNEDATLPASLLADDFEAEVAGKLVAKSIKLEAGEPIDETEKSSEKTRVSAAWRRRFAWSILLSIAEIELKVGRGDKSTLHADLSAIHQAILLAAAISNNCTSVEEWQKNLDDAAERRHLGNISGGHKRWEERAPYHAKVTSLARAYWKKHPDASAAEVSRGIIDKLYLWIDEQTEMCDDPKPQERSLAAYLEAKKAEILSP